MLWSWNENECNLIDWKTLFIRIQATSILSQTEPHVDSSTGGHSSMFENIEEKYIFITIPYFPLKSNTIAIWLIWPVSATIRSPWWSEGSLPHNHNLCAQSKVHCLLWSNTAQCIFRVATSARNQKQCIFWTNTMHIVGPRLTITTYARNQKCIDCYNQIQHDAYSGS